MRAEPTLGLVVRSLKGRDKGRYFAIVQIVDDDYVMIADGGLRKLEKPKKKKLKHLEASKTCLDAIVNKLNSGVHVFNAELRKSIEAAAEALVGSRGTPADGAQRADANGKEE